MKVVKVVVNLKIPVEVLHTAKQLGVNEQELKDFAEAATRIRETPQYSAEEAGNSLNRVLKRLNRNEKT